MPAGLPGMRQEDSQYPELLAIVFTTDDMDHLTLNQENDSVDVEFKVALDSGSVDHVAQHMSCFTPNHCWCIIMTLVHRQVCRAVFEECVCDQANVVKDAPQSL